MNDYQGKPVGGCMQIAFFIVVICFLFSAFPVLFELFGGLLGFAWRIMHGQH
jgi:hypothetical protein